jgi:DNA-directed RNA polymerase subunit RPC12/RpoP
METRGNKAETTETLEEKIRKDYQLGLSYRQLAKKYRKSPKTLTEIIKGVSVEGQRRLLSPELLNLPNFRHKRTVELLLSFGYVDDIENFYLLEPNMSCPYCGNPKSRIVPYSDENERECLKCGRQFTSRLYYVKDRVLSILFYPLIADLRKEGYEIHRGDLNKYLANQLHFAAIRWMKTTST